MRPAAAPAAAEPGRIDALAGAALDRRLDPTSRSPVAVALSGGGDSLALLRLAADWCAVHGRPLLAFTVDHGLNRDSRAWTAFAGRAAAAAGAGWCSLTWTGAKPATGLPAAARAARHRLLAQAARAAGAKVLLTGHTGDDVLEGEVMREADAPGLGRLREWAPSPAWPEGRGLFLLRPLMDVRRAELRAWLAARDLAWLDDPANADLSFARPRARARLRDEPPPEPEAPSPTPFEATADGRLVFHREGLGPHALSAAVLCAAGTARPPRGEAVARVLEALASARPVDATLAGARIVARGASVEIGREAGERFRGGLVEVALEPWTVWDGRFEASPDEPGWRLAPLGGLIARLGPDERRALRSIPAWARGGLPVLVHGETVRLPRPFGSGPATVASLAGARFRAACGLVMREGDIEDAAHGATGLVTLCSEPTE